MKGEPARGMVKLCPAGASAVTTNGGEVQATSHRVATLGNGRISQSGFGNEHAAMDSNFRRRGMYA
jgi:hypothetical protein